MNDTVQYSMASVLLLITGFLAACAGLWLAMQHEWAGAAGAATVALAAAAGLIGVGDRVAVQHASENATPWTAADADTEQVTAILEQLHGKGILERDA